MGPNVISMTWLRPVYGDKQDTPSRFATPGTGPKVQLLFSIPKGQSGRAKSWRKWTRRRSEYGWRPEHLFPSNADFPNAVCPARPLLAEIRLAIALFLRARAIRVRATPFPVSHR